MNPYALIDLHCDTLTALTPEDAPLLANQMVEEIEDKMGEHESQRENDNTFAKICGHGDILGYCYQRMFHEDGEMSGRGKPYLSAGSVGMISSFHTTSRTCRSRWPG